MYRFSKENIILFNKKKTICIKFGSKVKEEERVFLDRSDLLSTDNVVHIGYYINSACNEDIDCNIKNLKIISQLQTFIYILETAHPRTTKQLTRTHSTSQTYHTQSSPEM